MSEELAEAVSVMRAGSWDKPLTHNERLIIETIRLASFDSDPAPTLDLVQKLRQLFRLSGR